MAQTLNRPLLAGPDEPILPALPRDGLRPILPAVAVVYSFLLLPVEAGITIGSAFLPIFRVMLIASLPFIFVRLVRKSIRIFGPDVLMLLASVWVIVSFLVFYGMGVGIARGVPILIDITVPYFLARVSITTPNDLRRFFLLILPGLALVAAMMAVESIGGRTLVRPFFASVFGNASIYEGGLEAGALGFREHVRLGLLRAGATFSHPILAGAFLASTLPIWWMSRIRSWPRVIGLIVALACVFSVSSAAVLALALAMVMVGVDWGKQFLPKVGWPLISLVIVGGIVVLELVSKNGAAAIVARNTLDPHTAFYRLLIWEYGSATVAANPWFGIGYSVYDRPDWMTTSVDAHFLNLAIRHGLAMPLLMLGGIIWAMIALGHNTKRMKLADRDLAVGLNIVLAMLVLVGFTVAYFGESGVWFSMLIGIAASLSTFSPGLGYYAGE